MKGMQALDVLSSLRPTQALRRLTVMALKARTTTLTPETPSKTFDLV